MRGMAMLRNILKLDQRDYQPHNDRAVANTVESLRQLEESQRPLRQQIQETGFFLGDAYLLRGKRKGSA